MVQIDRVADALPLECSNGLLCSPVDFVLAQYREAKEGLEEVMSFIEQELPIGKEVVSRQVHCRSAGLDGWPLDM